MKPAVILLFPALLAGCATSPQAFYKNPAKADTTSLCRTVSGAVDPTFKDDVAVELERRGESPDSCKGKVDLQNAVIAGVAVAGAAVAVGVAAHNGAFDGAGGYGGYDSYAWDRYATGYGYQWRCRSENTGRFVADHMCAGLFKSDHRWPG